MRNHVLVIAAMAALAALALSTVAAAEPRTTATELDQITVIGTRTAISVRDNPASVTVIDREEIERKAPTSIAELLQDVPGIEVVDTSVAGMERVRIRGETSRRVTILIDGQELTDHSTYGTPLMVDPANVERVEVLRGAASVLYGAKAIGGVINIVTRKGQPGPPRASVGGNWYSGSNGYEGWSALSGGANGIDYRFSVSTDRHHDRKVPKGIYSATGKLENSSWHSSNVSMHLGSRFGADDKHYLALKANRYTLDANAWTDPFSFEYPVTNFRVDLPQRDLTKFGLYYDGHDLGPVVHKVHVDAYYQYVDRLFTNEVDMNPAPPMFVNVKTSSDDRNVNYGGTFQIDLVPHPDHYVIAGLYFLVDDLETRKTTDTSVTMGAAPPQVTHDPRTIEASARTVSGFVQDAWKLAPAWTLTGGLRVYRTNSSLDASTEANAPVGEKRTTDDLVGSLSLVWTGLEDQTWRLLYSEGYIMPTLLEMFTDNAAGRGVVTWGNPNLKPETSRNLEFGVRVDRGGLSLDTAAFYTRARHYITTRPCDAISGCPEHAQGGGHMYVNADRARTWGVEMTVDYAPANSAWTPYASASWIRRRLQFAPLPDTDGDLISYDGSVPRFTSRLGLRFEPMLARADLWADLYLRGATESRGAPVSDGQHLLVDETRTLPGWATLNFAIGTAFGAERQYKLNLHLNNLLDKSYRINVNALPALGRNLVLGFSAEF